MVYSVQNTSYSKRLKVQTTNNAFFFPHYIFIKFPQILKRQIKKKSYLQLSFPHASYTSSYNILYLLIDTQSHTKYLIT